MRDSGIVLITLTYLCSAFSCAALPEDSPLVATYAQLANLADGAKITARVTVSKEIWQHAVGFLPDYPETAYVDFPDGQSIVYSKTALPDYPCTLEINGTVYVLDAGSKKPGSKERVTEWHIVAKSWKILP